MPSPRPLPRKYLSQLQDIQEDLQLMAVRSRVALQEVERQSRPPSSVQTVLREIESAAYRLALTLAQIEIATDCDLCPAAPPTTSLQAYMLVLASELEAKAEQMRLNAGL